MRLIDADNYCAKVCRCNNEKCEKDNCPILCAPTAYDVDSVVEQLKSLLEIEKSDMEYRLQRSCDDKCIYNLYDLAERRYKAFCEAIEIINTNR